MIHVFIGTKAQLIKMAPVMSDLQNRGIEYNFVLTGQHKQTFDGLLSNFGIKQPDQILHSGREATTIPRVLLWSVKVFLKCIFNKKQVWRNDDKGIVLNHGDTFSTLLGSLLAKLAGLKSGHVESGLRSFNPWHPFPEELTRMCVFRLSDFFFCPGQWSLGNIQKHSGHKVDTKANTLYDSLQICLNRTLPSPKPDIPEHLFAVVSLHRFENIFNRRRFKEIVSLLEMIAQDMHLLFILHKPTERKLHNSGMMEHLNKHGNIEFRQRQDYFRFIGLIRHAEFVVTDGGSNQEECYYLGKPCLIMRARSERTEGLDHNAILSNFDAAVIKEFITDYKRYETRPVKLNSSPSRIIVDNLIAESLA